MAVLGPGREDHRLGADPPALGLDDENLAFFAQAEGCRVEKRGAEGLGLPLHDLGQIVAVYGS
jgi:hypothetical protein